MGCLAGAGWRGRGGLTPDELVNQLALGLLLVEVNVTSDSTANTVC